MRETPCRFLGSFYLVREGDRDRQLARVLEGGGDSDMTRRYHDECKNMEKWWSRAKGRDGMLGWYRI